jgi:geranylgeranyl reductase family protein
MKYDAIVVGAGPAGSTAARRLALEGARVLLLDKAPFPRDKPCGGGITFRADDENDIDLSPVTEREIYGARFSADMGRSFVRTSDRLLARMTQRERLDAYLAEQAVRAGADFRDGCPVSEIDARDDGVSVRARGDVFEAPVMVGADGVNGLTARTLGLSPASEHAVAFEANYPADDALMSQWERLIGLDLGGVPGGYCWVFPKGDHLNVGVGGWKSIGPTLRARLSRFCAYYGFDESRLFGHRGYQLPLRAEGQPVVRGRVMLAGDAAALVDPLSGEGIWAAFVSGRLAAAEAMRLLRGQIADLDGYGRALDALMRDEIVASRRLAAFLHLLPAISVVMLKYNDTFWRYLVDVIRGDMTYPEVPKKLGPLQHIVYRIADWQIARHRRELSRGARTSPA